MQGLHLSGWGPGAWWQSGPQCPTGGTEVAQIESR